MQTKIDVKKNMPFKIGDQVVHPRHGVGKIVKLVIKQFVQGEKRPYYEISFPGTTLWVPVSHPTSGLRNLSGKREIARCRRALKATPSPLNEDPRLRQSELVERLKQGTIIDYCKVVRDLNASNYHKPLSGAISAFLRVTQDVLCQEWAVVQNIPLAEAAQEIDSLLAKGRRANENG